MRGRGWVVRPCPPQAKSVSSRIRSIVAVASVDSRHYKFAFMFGSRPDCPAGFGSALPEREFRAGLLLTQGDSGRSDSSICPSRILLLSSDTIHIRAHPSSGERPVDVPIYGLQSVECGHILLLGWLRIAAADDRTLLYSIRSRPLVDRVLGELRDIYTPAKRGVFPFAPLRFDDALNAKFENLLFGELVPSPEAQATLRWERYSLYPAFTLLLRVHLKELFQLISCKRTHGTACGLLGTVNGAGDLVATALVGGLWIAISRGCVFHRRSTYGWWSHSHARTPD